MYVTQTEFYAAHPELTTEQVYEKHGKTAQRWSDAYTTGIDRVKKLSVAFPTNSDDVAAVKECWIALCVCAYRIDLAARALQNAQIVNGGVTSGIVESVSSGSESIKFAAPDDEYTKAVRMPTGGRGLAFGIVRDFLSGIADGNGVNLLYMGVYPEV